MQTYGLKHPGSQLRRVVLTGLGGSGTEIQYEPTVVQLHLKKGGEGTNETQWTAACVSALAYARSHREP